MTLIFNILNILKLPTEWWRILSLFGLSVFFIYFGIDHFINPDFYLSIMPPAFPFHAEAVYISGFFEILGGICVLIPSLRKLAGSIYLLGLFNNQTCIYKNIGEKYERPIESKKTH